MAEAGGGLPGGGLHFPGTPLDGSRPQRLGRPQPLPRREAGVMARGGGGGLL